MRAVIVLMLISGSTLALCGGFATSTAKRTGAVKTDSAKSEQEPTYWWHRYPTYVGDLGGSLGAEDVSKLHARMVSGNYAADPVWGPYGQRLSALQTQKLYEQVKSTGVRWLTWVEAFGDCMLYAAALERKPDGSFPVHAKDPDVTRLERIAWNWESQDVKRGNTFRWVGPHNTVNNEDFIQPLFTRERLGFPVPTYPDGRGRTQSVRAVGWIPGGQYPVNARVYDAVCAKDINGDLAPILSMLPEKANEMDAATGKPKGATEGLYRAVLTENDLPHFRDRKVGDVVYASNIAIEKDVAAPFWTDYARVIVRDILKRGVDGLWCDNYSPFNNFGMPPIRNGFGAWSEHRFHRFFRATFSDAEMKRMGIQKPASFHVRAYLKQKAVAFGAKDPSHYRDPAWRDARWLDDPVWNAYKVFKQKVGQEGLRNFYNAMKDEARRAERPDFLIAGNDMPVYALGWARDEWLDMVSAEQTPGWFVTTGSRGVMLPPLGKYAVVYRAALEHQKGPYATAWYYLNGPYEKYRGQPEVSKVLMAEAFANSTFLKYGGNPDHPGTAESVAWWNEFVTRAEPRFGRRLAVADVGILYSPDNQLAFVVPGSHALHHDRQPHSFGHWGFATAMIDAHIPYRVVVDWKWNLTSLKGLRAFIVPDAECLDDSVAPMLERWVRAGGRLVVTGPSGMREGTAGFFRKRKVSVLSSLIGRDTAESGDEVCTRRLGKGTVVWTSAPVGMDYYLKEKERSVRLSRIVDMVGASPLLDGKQLPTTVGAFCWKSADGKTLFTDLVNYNLDADADRVTPAENLTFRMRLPAGTRRIAVTTLSPEGEANATATVEDGWAVVRVPRLVYFASVKLMVK